MRPSGGDVPDPSRACAALAADPALITSPEPFTCAGGFSSWWDLAISGRLRGDAVRTVTSTCWTPQMRLIGKLGIGQGLEAHLLPRRVRMLFGRTAASFPPGNLRAGDLVRCAIDGRTLENGVPVYTEGPSEVGYEGKGIVGVKLTVFHHRDGSVSARCS